MGKPILKKKKNTRKRIIFGNHELIMSSAFIDHKADELKKKRRTEIRTRYKNATMNIMTTE